MRTLTETLMEEEANHSSNLCYKTASSYMFGAEMSSGFGSARFGSCGNLFFEHNIGQMTGDSSLNGWKLQERYDLKRSSDPHLNLGLSGPGGGYLGSFLGDAHKTKLKW